MRLLLLAVLVRVATLAAPAADDPNPPPAKLVPLSSKSTDLSTQGFASFANRFSVAETQDPLRGCPRISASPLR
jgi:hypothetical protein